MSGLPKLIVIAGIVLIVVGLGMQFLRLGRLPGDFVFRGENSTVYFPIMTSIVLSVLLTLVFFIINKLK